MTFWTGIIMICDFLCRPVLVTNEIHQEHMVYLLSNRAPSQCKSQVANPSRINSQTTAIFVFCRFDELES